MNPLVRIDQLRRKIIEVLLHPGDLLSISRFHHNSRVAGSNIGLRRDDRLAQIRHASLPSGAREIGPEPSAAVAHPVALPASSLRPEQLLTVRRAPNDDG